MIFMKKDLYYDSCGAGRIHVCLWEPEQPVKGIVQIIHGIAEYAERYQPFAQYLNDVNLDSRQIYFVNQIVEYIVHNGLMKDLSVLQESPFTDKGSVVEVFTDLTVWMGIRKIIEQVNANAIAA